MTRVFLSCLYVKVPVTSSAVKKKTRPAELDIIILLFITPFAVKYKLKDLVTMTIPIKDIKGFIKVFLKSMLIFGKVLSTARLHSVMSTELTAKPIMNPYIPTPGRGIR
jgi:hypothetical protein